MNQNNDPTPQRSLSQKRQCLAILQAGGTLTPRKARKLVGTYKLATRISELILEDGHTEIEKKLIWVRTRKGKTQVMRYSIPKNKRPASV